MKPGRNDLCSCGSGKKYKKCCQDKHELHSVIQPHRQHATQAEINQLVALFSAGRHIEIESQARLLIEQFPNSGIAWKVLGASFQVQGKYALPALQKATELMPGDAEAHYNLGGALQALGQLDDAMASYRRALKINPDFVEAHCNLGNLLGGLGQFDDAMASHRRVLEIKPDYANAHCGLGTALESLGKRDDAMESYRRALEINPDHVDALCNLGGALQALGQLDDAMVSYRRALEIKPDFAKVKSNIIFCLTEMHDVDAETLFSECCQFGDRFEAALRPTWPQHTQSRDPERSLQVGIVSADFRNHVVASYIEPVLAHLSRYPQLSLHAYYNYAIEDSLTHRLSGYMRHWHSIAHLSDAALAQKIRADNIDILIDLSGHSADNRLLTFARKPAPVQASWIGFPCTTGLLAMDYYLADRFALPPGQFDDQFTEKIASLPASTPYLPDKNAPPVNPLPALSHGYITFGSFNRISKINPAVIALWAKLLRALPDSRLLLAAMPAGGGQSTLVDWFAQEGIARERLRFHTRCSLAAYLELHHQVDICLDTFPYNGGATTLNANWMGVPTLTLAGCTAVGRAGVSILGHVGLDEFVAHGAEDFVQKGLSWAGKLAALSDIRAGLRERFAQSAMGQPTVVAAGVEHALRIMWRRWCADLPAEHFEVRLRAVCDEKQEADI